MQDWAHTEIESELREAEREFATHLEARDLEFVYVRIGGQWTFYIRRKRKKGFADDVEENLKVWASGLILNLVDFAIAMEAMREFIQALFLEAAQRASGSANGPSLTPKGDLLL